MRGLFIPAVGQPSIVDASPASITSRDVILSDLAIVHLQDPAGLPNLRASQVTQHGALSGSMKISGDALLLGWDSESQSPCDLPRHYLELYQLRFPVLVG